MSNLLDKASIILTPTAYNNGEALCVKPSDGSGDFDFSRNSAATRVNAQGLVENVQILSSNLVQNGDFSEEGVQEISNGSFSQEGSELITNGDFSSDTAWVKGAEWSISGGSANCDGTQVSNSLIYQNIGSQANKTVKFSFTVTNYVSGVLETAFFGAAGTIAETISANGDYTFYIAVQSGHNGNTGFTAKVGFNGSIENCSVREVGQDWDLGTGWSIGEDKAIHTGAQSLIGQTNILTIGKSYKITFDLSGADGFNYARLLTSQYPNGGNYTNNGTITVYTTTNIDDLYIYGVGDISITNISVKEVGQNWTSEQGIWTFGDGVANGNGASGSSEELFQNLSASGIVVGDKVKLSFEIKNYVSGSVQAIGITPTPGKSANGVYEYIGEVTSLNFRMRGSSFNGSITNISVIEITDDTNLPRINYEGFSYQDALGSELITNGSFDTDSDWVKQNGATISNGMANFIFSNSKISQSISAPTINKVYRVEFDSNQINLSTTAVIIYGNGFYGLSNIPSVGKNILYITTNLSGGSQINTFQLSAGANGSIDNVSVKEYLGQSVVPESGCGSWLFEPQSTNLVTYSSDLSNAAWGNYNFSGANMTEQFGVLSPDGSINATRLTYTNTSIGSGGSLLTNNITLVANAQYTISFYAKHVSGTKQIRVDLKNSSSGGVSGASFTLTNEWKRYTKTVTNDSETNRGVQFRILESEFQGDRTFDVWGVQLEQQSYATSYIPTEGSTVTRNQDLCTNGGSLASINSTEGVLYAEIAALSNPVDTPKNITISDGTANNYVRIEFYQDGKIYGNVYDGTSVSASFVVNQDEYNKVAIQYSSSGSKLYVNGVGLNFASKIFSSNTLDTLQFSNAQNSASYFQGKTKCIAVWKEALTDQELTELTTI